MASRGANKVIILGRVGQDPEVRYSPSGTAFANTWVECTRAAYVRAKDKGELTRVVTNHPNNELKDHQIRELVNELRDIAVQYHGTQQLREKIARAVNNSVRKK